METVAKTETETFARAAFDAKPQSETVEAAWGTRGTSELSLRKSDLFLAFLFINGLLFCLMTAHAIYQQKANAPLVAQREQIVEKLQLTDLCLFTDARYTRHPSVADMNTPFQDYPLSFEHFPSGSIIPLPPHLKQKQLGSGQ